MKRESTKNADTPVRAEGLLGDGAEEESAPRDHAFYATCEAVGDIIQFWGFKKLTGVVWCYLYLSPSAKSAAEIRADLKLSTGSVSMTLKELLHWGVVLKSTSIGERCQRYTAESDLWKMVSKVLRERDLEQINRTLGTLRDSREDYTSRAGNSEEAALHRFRAERLDEMVQAGDLVAGLISKLLKTGRMNIRPLWPLLLGSLSRSGSGRDFAQKKGTGS